MALEPDGGRLLDDLVAPVEATPSRDVTPLRLVPAEGHPGAASPNRLVVYDWFTRVGTPPRAGNAVEVLVDGEAAWHRVTGDLAAAGREVQIATWMCRPDHELERPEELALAEPAARVGRRFGDHVDALTARGVDVRLLIWGMARTPIVNPWLRRWHWRGGPHVWVLEQDHKRLIGSYHQKTMTIDGRVGYCGGMNLKENDWDTSDHRVFEPRREPHAASAAKRRKVAERKAVPPFPPRHDFIVRIEGPAVGDIAANFRARWDQSVAQRARTVIGKVGEWIRLRLGQAPIAPLATPAPRPGRKGEVLLQVVRTTPEGEHGILDAYRRAIRNARRYVYIEDQYFRSELLADELARALDRNPHLRLAVVAPALEGPVEVLFDPASYWTARMQEAVTRVRPEFRLTKLVVHDVGADGQRVWLPVDVHAKIMVVDDTWFTIGSANINDRGFTSEAEINVAVQDKTLARALRIRLMAEHLEVPPGQAEATLGDVDAAFDLWDRHARENPRRREADQAPVSRVHAFVQARDASPPLGIGPDVF